MNMMPAFAAPDEITSDNIGKSDSVFNGKVR
jgi:hypothetical protein